MAINGSLDRLISLETSKMPLGSMYIILSSAIACIFILPLIVLKLQAAYGTTLRHVPGPWYTKYTRRVLEGHDVFGNRWYYIQALHKKYGPVVRIAPDEVAVCDPKHVTQVLGLGTKFRKRQQPGTAFNIFSLSDPKLHRPRQRFYNKAFSDENIKANIEPAIRKLAHMAVERIKTGSMENRHRTVDVVKWCMLYGYDCVFDVVFGTSTTEGLMATNGSTDTMIVGLYLQRSIAWMLFCYSLWAIGRWLSPLSKTLADVFCIEHKYVDLFQEGPRQKAIAAKTVFFKKAVLPQDGDAFATSDGTQLRDMDITHDITTFLGAGGEAVAVTLIFLIWQVLKIPTLQRELEAEVASLPEPPTDVNTAPLPILNAVILETLRVWGGGATHLPRYSPVVTDLGGFIIPPGTAVTPHIGALHRNPEAWDNPEIYDHTRWLSSSQSKAPIQDKFQPFSSGARACIAIHLALIEMRIFTATFFRDCAGAKLSPLTTDASMRVLDRFHIGPTSGRCMIILPKTS